MNERARHLGFGSLCLAGGVILQASWIPILMFLDGRSWPSAQMAAAGHNFALTFLVGAPLGYGAFLLFGREGGGRKEALSDWFLNCLLPSAGYAAVIKLCVQLLPHITTGAIVWMMFATLPLGVYGTVLRRQAASV